MARALPLLLALLALLPSALPAAAPAPDAPAWAPGVRGAVVGFRGGIPADAGAWLAAWGGEEHLRDATLGWVAVRFPDAAHAARFAAHAAARGDVRYAEPDGPIHGSLVPDDPRFGEQWGLLAIQAPPAWDITLGSPAVRIAVLDTGLDGAHPDLAGNVCGPHASFVGGDPLVDGNGHGTHVAGIAAARTDNGLGVAGTSQSCLLSVQVLTAGGAGQWSGLAAGIRWAADAGAHVLSMSLGGANPPQAVRDAVQHAYLARGALLVAAAGGGGCGAFPPPLLGPGTVAYPAAYPEVLAVAALARPGDTAAGSSACGLPVELAAPGEAILSTWRGGGYAVLSGSSMAAPFVAGVAGLVLATDPSLGAQPLRCLLDLSADDLLPLPGRDPWTGWGRVNASRALVLDAALGSLGQHAAFAGACAAAAPVVMG